MNWHPLVAGLVPSIAVGLVFWYAMRAVLRADRNERTALAAADAAREAERSEGYKNTDTSASPRDVK
jgi:hypothetical protein